MAEQLAEIDKIANNSAPPDFENTIAALERAGAAYDRASTLYFIWASNMSTPEFQSVQREMAGVDGGSTASAWHRGVRVVGNLYGAQFLNPPSTPILIVDRHGVAHPLPFGIKSVDELFEAVNMYLQEGM